MLSLNVEQRRAGILEASFAIPYPIMSPFSWLPLPIHPVILYAGNYKPRIDWTVSARSNPYSVDTMTREAEYVALQINERIQTLNMASPVLLSP